MELRHTPPKQHPVRVLVEHIETPDAHERLRRAFALLLSAARRHESSEAKDKEGPHEDSR